MQGGGVFCAVCEFVMEKLESLLDTNSTKVRSIIYLLFIYLFPVHL